MVAAQKCEFCEFLKLTIQGHLVKVLRLLVTFSDIPIKLDPGLHEVDNLGISLVVGLKVIPDYNEKLAKISEIKKNISNGPLYREKWIFDILKILV